MLLLLLDNDMCNKSTRPILYCRSIKYRKRISWIIHVIVVFHFMAEVQHKVVIMFMRQKVKPDLAATNYLTNDNTSRY